MFAKARAKRSVVGSTQESAMEANYSQKQKANLLEEKMTMLKLIKRNVNKAH